MLVDFFATLRKGGVPATLTEFLTLLDALAARVAVFDAEEFYFLARACLVKDERLYDRFDRAFAVHFRGALERFDQLAADVPHDWLHSEIDRLFTEEEKRKIEALGGWDALMRTLRERLEEQRERHEGGSRWIGTRGTSPFGSGGYNPEGVRIGQAGARQRRAVKVWERREYRNLDDRIELGTRNLKLALRRLRELAREGVPEVLDLEGTIAGTARNAGLLDLHLVPERRNAVRILLLLDVGGSMDEHVRVSEELFSAARSEFGHLVSFYFHNCVYERLWTDNRRAAGDYRSTLEVLRTYGREYRVILVGDASMSPYELLYAGGSVEHVNEEPGHLWLRRVLATYPRAAWLNPEPEKYWPGIPSIGMIRELMSGRMYPMTLDGLGRAVDGLRRDAATAAPGSGEAPERPYI